MKNTLKITVLAAATLLMSACNQSPATPTATATQSTADKPANVRVLPSTDGTAATTSIVTPASSS